MINKIDKNGFDREIICSDWRYSAAVVGMIRFMKDQGIDFAISTNDQGMDALYYHSAFVVGKEAENAYLKFVEHYFKDKMIHLKLEHFFEEEQLSDEQIKSANEWMNGKSSNAILKKVFKGEKYEVEERGTLMQLLALHRQDIIKETYRNSLSMYRNFANTNCLSTEKGKICRLNGYCIDLGKKSKSVAFNWNFKKITANDEPEFDYIPFAFTRTYESFFINNNFSIENLCKSNNHLQNFLDKTNGTEEGDPRNFLFGQMKEASEFINYNVEVVEKDRNNDYFNTVFIRKQAIEIFQKIKDKYDVLRRPCQIKNISKGAKDVSSCYLNMVKIVTTNILNHIYLDNVIEQILKDTARNHNLLVDKLIDINQCIYGTGGNNMDSNIIKAKMTAGKVVSVFIANKKENKISTYRNKLIAAITFHDYDRFNEVLLQLTAYSGVVFDFAYELFDDFEKNKNIAYAFVNALHGWENNKNAKENGGINNDK